MVPEETRGFGVRLFLASTPHIAGYQDLCIHRTLLVLLLNLDPKRETSFLLLTIKMTTWRQEGEALWVFWTPTFARWYLYFPCFLVLKFNL